MSWMSRLAESHVANEFDKELLLEINLPKNNNKICKTVNKLFHNFLLFCSKKYNLIYQESFEIIGKKINYLVRYKDKEADLQNELIKDLFLNSGARTQKIKLQTNDTTDSREVYIQFESAKERYEYLVSMIAIDLNYILRNGNSNNVGCLDQLNVLIDSQMATLSYLLTSYESKLSKKQTNSIVSLSESYRLLKEKALNGTDRPKTTYQKILHKRQKVKISSAQSLQYINARLGEGGMQQGSSGALVRLENEKGHVFALKHLWPIEGDPLEDAQVEVIYPDLIGFLHERKLIQLLQHDNIVTYIDGGYWDKPIEGSSETLPVGEYMVLEFADRGDLSKVFREEISDIHVLERNMNYIFQIGKGLRHMHRKGVVHRDLKPANVLLFHDGSENGVAKIADFDASCRTKDRKRMHQHAGSMDRAAPEMKRSDFSSAMKFAEKGDVWMYGLLIAEGLNPSATENFRERYANLSTREDLEEAVLQLQINLNPLKRVELGPVIEMVGRMLSYEPEKRPSMNTVLGVMGKFNAQIQVRGYQHNK